MSSDAMPSTLAFGIALTCGLLAGLAAHVALINAGWGLGAFLHDIVQRPPASLRSAIAWWLIAAVAFTASGLTTALTGRARLRPLTGWILAAATAGLAFAGHAAQVPPGISAGTTLALHLAAGAVAGLMAFAGAYVGIRLPQGTRRVG